MTNIIEYIAVIFLAVVTVTMLATFVFDVVVPWYNKYIRKR